MMGCDFLTFDLVVIGGGPAGYHAALIAGRAGLKTLLIEKQALGGVCLHAGCIPSKTFLQSAKIFSSVEQGKKYGVTVANLQFNHQRVRERKNKVVRILAAGLHNKLKKYNVTYLEAQGRIVKKRGTGTVVEAAGQLYFGKNILIA